jgi:acylphosphatase
MASPGMTSRRFVIAGVVQGVGFRWFVARHAHLLGLSGYARNLPDGRVEVVASGEDDALARLEGLLRAGPPHARVTDVEREDDVNNDTVPSRSFDIR